jgi:hypothetical protein
MCLVVVAPSTAATVAAAAAAVAVLLSIGLAFVWMRRCHLATMLSPSVLHVVFMPRCERWLYENFLAAHATRAHGSAPPLRRVVLIGNTFQVFEHQSPHDPALRSQRAPPPPPSSERTEEEEGEDAAEGRTSAPPETERPYWQGHRETPLPVAPGAPYWTALSGLVAHEWDV